MRRLAAFLALALVAGLISSPALAQTSAGSVSVRLLDPPPAAKDDPRAKVYIVDHLHQGDEITRHIQVGNTTSEPIDAELYADAASVTNGQFRWAEPRATNELSSWTTVTPSTLHVPAGGTANVEVKVAIPKNAVDGERYGVIFAAVRATGGNITSVNQVGIRMYVSVGEGAEPVTDFTIDALRPKRDADGRPVVETKVTNTGGRAIDLSGKLQLTDGPGSLSAGPFDMQLGTTLAPKESAPATVRLDKNLPDGPWTATVTVVSGDVTHTAKAKLTFPSKAGATGKDVPAESTKRQRRIFIPIAIALVLLALLALIVYVLNRRRTTPLPA